LNIQKELLSDHQVKLTVSIPPEPLEEAKRRAARQIAKKVKIPGFRPGKAPYAVVLRSVGESAIFQEAVELLADETYPKVLDEAEIKPWGPGSLKDIPAQDPLTFEFVVPLQPEVTLSDYRALRFPYELKATTEEEVEQAIEDLRDRHATYETIMDRPAREGDQVSIRIKAERKTVAENQSLALINERDSELTINAESDDTSKEWPFSGFSRRLVGLNPGDEINFDYTYPEDSTLENLRGVEAVFYVQVVAIKLRTLPEVNEEFLKSLGEFKDVDEFRGIVRQNLERQAKALYDRD